MKGRSILAVVAALLAIGALAAVAIGCNPNKEDPDKPKPVERSTEDFVDYYGCPNSRRVKKLNLKKTKG